MTKNPKFNKYDMILTVTVAYNHPLGSNISFLLGNVHKWCPILGGGGGWGGQVKSDNIRQGGGVDKQKIGRIAIFIAI